MVEPICGDPAPGMGTMNGVQNHPPVPLPIQVGGIPGIDGASIRAHGLHRLPDPPGDGTESPETVATHLNAYFYFPRFLRFPLCFVSLINDIRITLWV
jgi:hypothetical protein